jgi:menaquinone-dependent protoporphyrinogen oxidase
MEHAATVPRVLVAYASKHGSTAEIARRVASTLNASGVLAASHDADSVKEPTQYHAIVLGSAVYAGHWLAEAVDFLRDNEGALVSRPVWLFSSGPTGEQDVSELLDGWRFPHDQQALAEHIQPRDIKLFHGKIDPERLTLGERLVIKAMRGTTGDFRRWDEIDTWAKSIAQAVLSAEVPRKAMS